MNYTPQPNTFSLFLNDKGGNEKRPDRKGDGNIVIDGKTYNTCYRDWETASPPGPFETAGPEWGCPALFRSPPPSPPSPDVPGYGPYAHRSAEPPCQNSPDTPPSRIKPRFRKKDSVDFSFFFILIHSSAAKFSSSVGHLRCKWQHPLSIEIFVGRAQVLGGQPQRAGAVVSYLLNPRLFSDLNFPAPSFPHLHLHLNPTFRLPLSTSRSSLPSTSYGVIVS